MKKILFLNGSPRLKGNTRFALKTLEEQIDKTKSEVEFIDVTKFNVAGCIACDSCKRNDGKCFMNDNTNELAQKIVDADTLIFGSPVYWWGISAQLKALIDKMYSKAHGTELTDKKKRVGLISVGADEIGAEQYNIISSQFRCICEYLGWEFFIDEAISAHNPNDLSAQNETLSLLKELGESLN
ncbi:MAG: flavodoxin family protein [Cetobacterium sp.]